MRMDRLRPLQWIGAVAAALLAVLLVSTAALAESAETGVLVRSVAADSPAAEAGIVRGDIILAFDGEALEDAAALVERMAEAEPGDTLALTVRHGDEEFTVEATLGESDGRAYLGVLPDYGAGGWRWDDRKETWGRHGAHLFGMMPFTDTASGALVSEVVEDSPAEEAGLVTGDVILGADAEKLTVASARRFAKAIPMAARSMTPGRRWRPTHDEMKATWASAILSRSLGRTDDGKQVVPTPPYHGFGRRPYRHPSWHAAPRRPRAFGRTVIGRIELMSASRVPLVYRR